MNKVFKIIGCTDYRHNDGHQFQCNQCYVLGGNTVVALTGPEPGKMDLGLFYLCINCIDKHEKYILEVL